MTHTSPAHISDMQEAVYSTQIDKCAEISDIFHDTDSYLIFLKFLDECFLLFCPCFLEHLSPADDYVPAALVKLDNPEVVIVSQKLLKIRHLAKCYL